MGEYLAAVVQEDAAVAEKLRPFEESLKALQVRFTSPQRKQGKEEPLLALRAGKSDALIELREAADSCAEDQARLLRELDGFGKKHTTPAQTNRAQHAARKAFEPIAERMRGLVKQVDLVYKLAAGAVDAAGDDEDFDRRGAARQLKQLDAARKDAVEQLKRMVYFHKQVVWLQDRFPEAKLRDVPGG